MASRKSSIPIKNHILAVSAKLFLEQGYRNTTIKQIADTAEVSVSSIQNFFHSKEGLIIELTHIMFSGQFDTARKTAKAGSQTIYTYAAETAIQLVLTERNENLREIYTEAYTISETLEYIHQITAKELKAIFGDRFPDYEESDFYEMEIGTASLMRGYMAKPCDVHFPLHRKIERFLTASLRVYRVGEEEIVQILSFIRGLNLNALVDEILAQLFDRLKHYFECDFPDMRDLA